MATHHRIGTSVLSRPVVSPSGCFGVTNFEIRNSGFGALCKAFQSDPLLLFGLADSMS